MMLFTRLKAFNMLAAFSDRRSRPFGLDRVNSLETVGCPYVFVFTWRIYLTFRFLGAELVE